MVEWVVGGRVWVLIPQPAGYWQGLCAVRDVKELQEPWSGGKGLQSGRKGMESGGMQVELFERVYLMM